MVRVFVSLFCRLSIVGIATLLSACLVFNDVYVGGVPLASPDAPLEEVVLYATDAGQQGCLGGIGAEGPRILLIPIEGVIGDGGILERDVTSPAYVRRVLDTAAQDSSIRAILIHVNSPGGTVSASDLIYHMISEYSSRRNLPVYAHVADLGASGGYYIAMAARNINAQPTAIVGSIGVIMGGFELSGLMEKLGITYNTIRSGENKDTLSPFRPMREDERARLEAQIERTYEGFLSIVSNGRGDRLSGDELRNLADGRVFDAEQSRQYRLVDSVGYIEDYIDTIRREAGIGNASVVAYLPEGTPAHNLYDIGSRPAVSALSRLEAMGLVSGYRLFYIWEAGL